MLTDAQIRAVKAPDKPIKLFDERGLYLLVNPNGSRYWRLKYRAAGRERGISLGVYPGVALKDARARRDEARRLLASGVDPSDERKAAKAQAPLSTGVFEKWFIEQHGARPGPGEGSDRSLLVKVHAGERAQSILNQRIGWDARHASALWAWQARERQTPVSGAEWDWANRVGKE